MIIWDPSTDSAFAPLVQSVEFGSYEPTVTGSNPVRSIPNVSREWSSRSKTHRLRRCSPGSAGSNPASRINNKIHNCILLLHLHFSNVFMHILANLVALNSPKNSISILCEGQKPLTPLASLAQLVRACGC